MDDSEDKFDIIVIGGGTAGLPAALGAIEAEENCKVLLLEKNDQLGKKIRGELIYDDEEILEILFENGLPLHLINIQIFNAKYYSPSTLNYYERIYKRKKISIEYRILLQELAKKAITKGVKILLNARVSDFIKENDEFVGIKCIINNEERVIKSKIIISADGAHSKLRKIVELKDPECIYPLIKTIAENIKLQDKNQLEFFLTIDPPGVLWIFPRSKDSAEVGYTIFTNFIENKDINIEKLFDKHLNSYPIFSERLQDASFTYHASDFLPFCGPVKRINANNIFFVGDAMGHVGAVGGSGVISSMSIGYLVGNYLSNNKNSLSEEVFLNLYEFIKKSEAGKFLKKEQKTSKLMKSLLYKSLGSSKKIDENWEKIKNLMSTRD